MPSIVNRANKSYADVLLANRIEARIIWAVIFEIVHANEFLISATIITRDLIVIFLASMIMRGCIMWARNKHLRRSSFLYHRPNGSVTTETFGNRIPGLHVPRRQGGGGHQGECEGQGQEQGYDLLGFFHSSILLFVSCRFFHREGWPALSVFIIPYDAGPVTRRFVQTALFTEKRFQNYSMKSRICVKRPVTFSENMVCWYYTISLRRNLL